MAQQKQDIRAARTEQAIRTAFEEMIMHHEQPIRVTALAKKAGINRKTFYLHYDTIEDLVNTYVDDARVDLLDRLSQHAVKDYLAERGLLINTLTAFFLANQEFYSYILFQDDHSGRIRQIRDDLSTRMAEAITKATDYSLNDATIIVSFSANTILSLLRLRLAGKLSLTPEQIREKSVELSVSGLRGAMGLDI